MQETLDVELQFRRVLMSALMACIRSGESCALVGVSGVGKSALLRHLQKPVFKKHYLGENSERVLFVFMDCNLLAEQTEWGVIELLVESISKALRNISNREYNTPLNGAFEEIAKETRSTHERTAAQRNLSRIIELVKQAGYTRIVFFLDEFDDILGRIDATFLNNLRGLRDESRPSVVYVTLTRRVLPLVRPDIKRVAEGFNEMFRSTFPLTPYNRSDARAYISELIALAEFPLSQDQVAGLIRATGGHAGLIKAGFEHLRKRTSNNSSGIWAEMLLDPIVNEESKKIWQSVQPREQKMLCAIARREPVVSKEQPILHNLVLKGLVLEQPHQQILFSHLFAEFVKRQKGAPQ